MPAPSFLTDPGLQLLLFGGKGGVGKTTCATATALRLASSFPGTTLLLVSIDPAHSVADSLAGLQPPDNLSVVEVDAQECLQAFTQQHHQELHQIVSCGTFLDQQDVDQFLALSLPGLDELMAFLEISQWVKQRDYDCIIVDTAPTEHSLRLLTMPELMRGWLGALDALLAKHRYLRARFQPAAQPEKTDLFLEGLQDRLEGMESLLRDPQRCRFVPVMLADSLSHRETLILMRQLKRLKVAVGETVVNRLLPPGSCPVCADGHDRQREEVQKLFLSLAGNTFWGVPLYPFEVRGSAGLAAFWDNASRLQAETVKPRQRPAPRAVPVEQAAQCPSPDLALLLFAGKGGVGKTTLSCATAIHLSHTYPHKRVLLFSADPAHSLSACLNFPLHSTPSQVRPGLWAMEIDAQAEFDVLKQEYREELHHFLESLLPNVEVAYDREVMERILELSPPGLDEVMAMTGIADFLTQDDYDLVVVDTAPTGHLLRLLELPRLIDQWLKVFFQILLKYKHLLHVPKIAQRLVLLSKKIKRFRALLGDPGKSALYAVSILTRMALEESRDLLQACQRMRISAPVLFHNLATPAGSCRLCSALHRQEQEVRGEFLRLFPRLPQPLIYRQGELCGLPNLEILAQTLYSAAPAGASTVPRYANSRP